MEQVQDFNGQGIKIVGGLHMVRASRVAFFLIYHHAPPPPAQWAGIFQRKYVQAMSTKQRQDSTCLGEKWKWN